jgi:hypothetical protein
MQTHGTEEENTNCLIGYITIALWKTYYTRQLQFYLDIENFLNLWRYFYIYICLFYVLL